MEYMTEITYDLWVNGEHFENTREECETRTKRIETLVQNMSKKGWPCKLCRKSDGYNSGLYGVIYERFRKTEFWSKLGEIDSNQIIILGEHPEIHEFLSKYDIRQTRDMNFEERSFILMRAECKK